MLNQKGQTIIEVVFILPVFFLFIVLLYKITMAVQVSINNTQFARAQVYVLTANSPEYPRLSFRWNPAGLAAKSQDRMVLGVSDPSAVKKVIVGVADTIEPIPQTQKIARIGTEVKGSTDRGEVKLRNEIRIRNTSGICTQLNSAGTGIPLDPDTARGIASQRWPFKMPVCQYAGFGGVAIEAGE